MKRKLINRCKQKTEIEQATYLAGCEAGYVDNRWSLLPYTFCGWV